MSETQNLPVSVAYRRYFLLVACAGFASTASMRLCDTLLPELARSFDVQLSATAGAVSMFAIAYGILQLFYGPLGDRYGKQLVINLAVAVSAFINLAIAFSADLSMLIVLRFLAGAAAAGIIPLAMAYVGDSVPYSHRQPELAKLLQATIMGMIFGQWAGGLFADTIGWRAAFLLLALLFGVVALLTLRAGGRSSVAAPAQSERSNYASQISLILRTAWARRILLAAFIEGAAGHGALVFIPVYLHQRFDLSLSIAGSVVVLYGLGGLAYAMLARGIISRLGERGMTVSGGLLTAAGYGLLVFAPSWPWSVPACVMAGFGFYQIHNTLQTNATQMVPQARGTAVSLFACSLFLGQSIGISIIAFLLTSHDIRMAFIPSIVILPVLGLWLAWSIKNRR